MEQELGNEEEERPDQFYSPNTQRTPEESASQDLASQTGQGQPGPSQPGPRQENAQSGKAASKVKNPCLMCGKSCTSGCIQCTICSLWCHMPCTKLSKEVIKGLEVQAREVGQAYWACRSCMNFNHKWNTLMKETTRRQEETDARVEDNRRNITRYTAWPRRQEEMTGTRPQKLRGWLR